MNRGFSLVTVMIAMGLTGLIGFAVMSLMEQSSKTLKHAQLGADAIDFEYLLEDIFKSKQACTATFGKIASGSITGYTARDTGGYTPSDSANLLADGTGILNGNFQPLFNKDDKVMGGYTLKEVKIKAQLPVPNNPGTTKPNLTLISGNMYFMQVDVLLDKPGDKNLAGENKLIQFNITAIMETVSGAQRIKECQLTGSQDNLLTWEDVPLTDTNDFDPECAYRFKLASGTYVTSTFAPYGMDPAGGWFHMNVASKKTLIYTAHLATISYVNSLTKSNYQVIQDANGLYPADFHNPNAYTVSQIQKRCN